MLTAVMSDENRVVKLLLQKGAASIDPSSIDANSRRLIRLPWESVSDEGLTRGNM